jgi:hypothetical protein
MDLSSPIPSLSSNSTQMTSCEGYIYSPNQEYNRFGKSATFCRALEGLVPTTEGFSGATWTNRQNYMVVTKVSIGAMVLTLLSSVHRSCSLLSFQHDTLSVFCFQF